MRIGYIIAVGFLLASCALAPQPPATQTGTTITQKFTSPYGVVLQYPPEMEPTTNFRSDYLMPSVWSVFDGEGVEGEQIVEFMVPGSNDVTAAGLRVGASRVAVDSCLMAPDYGPFQKTTRTFEGHTFTVLTLSDAAMSHYREVRSHRLVHKGVCLVFDEFVSGTNQDVYGQPRTANFTKEEGFSRADAVLKTLLLE